MENIRKNKENRIKVRRWSASSKLMAERVRKKGKGKRFRVQSSMFWVKNQGLVGGKVKNSWFNG